MAIGNRNPQPKQIKVKDAKLIQYYKSRNPFCEACTALGTVINHIFTMELHHIHGGSQRSDETRNIIHICHEHHERATTHNLKHGSESSDWNHKYIAIKCQKGEVSHDDLVEWKCLEPVMKYIIEIYGKENEQIIKRMEKQSDS